MTKPGPSLLAVLLDRSSAARPVADAIRTGVDAQLTDQRERPGALLVTLASRNGAGQETACALRPVAEVGPVALHPRGTSALHAGIATLIDDVGAELAGLHEAERPERVVVAVVGDAGADGTDSEQVRELVARQPGAGPTSRRWSRSPRPASASRRRRRCSPARDPTACGPGCGRRRGSCPGRGSRGRGNRSRGFTDDERAAASVPARPSRWRRVLGRTG